MKLPYLCLLVILTSCWGKGDSSRKLSPVRASEIEYGEIVSGCGGTVSVKLEEKQIVKLAGWINTTKNARMYKSMCGYVIVLKTSRDTLSYKLSSSGKFLGEGDLYIELKDSTYFPEIYKTGKKQPALIRF